jgi:hypothetical protein
MMTDAANADPARRVSNAPLMVRGSRNKLWRSARQSALLQSLTNASRKGSPEWQATAILHFVKDINRVPLGNEYVRQT